MGTLPSRMTSGSRKALELGGKHQEDDDGAEQEGHDERAALLEVLARLAAVVDPVTLRQRGLGLAV